jgi:hypothetical protein
MNTVKEKYTPIETIELIISRKTLQICDKSTNTQLAVGINIFNFFKKFKPVFDEYPLLNGFLTQLKMYQRGNCDCDMSPIVNTFHNNFNFYNRISNNTNLSKYIKSFMVTLSVKNEPLNDTIELKVLGIGITKNVSCKSDVPHHTDNLLNLTHEQIKHEIANSLNLINMSNILINNTFKNPELEKYTNIITAELQNTTNILNYNHINRNTTDKGMLTIYAFYNYINNYLTHINTIYNINSDGIINIEPLTDVILLYSYISIKQTWFKIILDNIFKNIYGHIGESHTLLLKHFDVYYDKEFNTLCIDITNKRVLTLTTNTNRCQLYKEIADKYDLSTINPNLYIMPIKKNNSQGLTLINILCEKQNITWHLLELPENEYIFKLEIPVYNNLNMNSCHLSNDLINNAKISNLYLNEQVRESII